MSRRPRAVWGTPRAAASVARVGACLGAVLVLATPARAAPASSSVVQFGRSAAGHPIRVARHCAADATVDVLVVGVIHGNETAGLPVVSRLAHTPPPPHTCLWLLAALNPDGVRRGTRHNARGVDLNRNFPTGWRGGGRPFDTYFAGRARASEPETRAAMAAVRRIRPDATVWYHQHLAAVLTPALPWRVALARVYERVSGLAMRSYTSTGGPPTTGTASAWQAAEQPLSLPLVVELPAGPLPARSLARHAAAVRALAVAAGRDHVDAP
ncbi:MAG: murein peptide amidase [Thermoleophilia bacterium]|nr:murein peptide amidase [Thermoleophilia bacterium]